MENLQLRSPCQNDGDKSIVFYRFDSLVTVNSTCNEAKVGSWLFGK